jgi:hypothetical protein
MPGVSRLVREKRRVLGDAHVDECWRRGVLNLEPGWFFACEGPLTVGVPLAGDAAAADFLAARLTRTQALLQIREPEASHGT